MTVTINGQATASPFAVEVKPRCLRVIPPSRAANSHSCAERSADSELLREFSLAPKDSFGSADVARRRVFQRHLIDIVRMVVEPGCVWFARAEHRHAHVFVRHGVRQGGTFDVDVRNDGINVGNTPSSSRSIRDGSIVVLLAPVPPASEGGTQSGQEQQQQSSPSSNVAVTCSAGSVCGASLTAGETREYTLVARDALDNDRRTPGGEIVTFEAGGNSEFGVSNPAGTHSLDFVRTATGNYAVTVKLSGTEVSNSGFVVEVVPAVPRANVSWAAVESTRCPAGRDIQGAVQQCGEVYEAGEVVDVGLHSEDHLANPSPSEAGCELVPRDVNASGLALRGNYSRPDGVCMLPLTLTLAGKHVFNATMQILPVTTDAGGSGSQDKQLLPAPPPPPRAMPCSATRPLPW